MKVADRFLNLQTYTPIEPYDVLSQKLGFSPDQIIKLDANENPYGPAPAVKQSLSNLEFINIYPDPESRALRRALAEFTGVDQKYLMASAGADELIDLLLRVMLDPGDSVINCPPTFGMYSFDTYLNNGAIKSINRNVDFSINVVQIEKAVSAYAPKIIFLTSPNNPDGGLITETELLEILKLPVLVVLDEAYIEFTGNSKETWQQNSRIKMVSKFDNLVVLRTFSKWAGLAGLRVGYGAFPEWLMPTLWATKQPYNVNVAASNAAIQSLGSLDFLSENINKIREERSLLFEKLKNIPFLTPLPSESNFILCRVEHKAGFEIKQYLEKQGILVRFYDTPLLKNYIRISIGKPCDHKRLIQVLEELE
jgi:histidinol-phosphate aminotransferase